MAYYEDADAPGTREPCAILEEGHKLILVTDFARLSLEFSMEEIAQLAKWSRRIHDKERRRTIPSRDLLEVTS